LAWADFLYGGKMIDRIVGFNSVISEKYHKRTRWTKMFEELGIIILGSFIIVPFVYIVTGVSENSIHLSGSIFTLFKVAGIGVVMSIILYFFVVVVVGNDFGDIQYDGWD